MSTTTTEDVALAARLAKRAGEILLAVRHEGGLAPEALGRAGDAAANRYLVEALRTVRPDDGLLSEEMKCDGARLARRRVWIVDPVDGTREYGEGRDDWAVHVGLAVDGVASVGAVALPSLGLVMRSDAPPAARGAARDRPRMVVSRTRSTPEIARVAAALDADLIAMGSAGAKAMAVVRGEADVYLHTGGQFEWDSCAPVAVALAAGLHASRADGAPLRYNRADPYVPDLLVCRRAWADPVIRALASP